MKRFIPNPIAFIVLFLDLAVLLITYRMVGNPDLTDGLTRLHYIIFCSINFFFLALFFLVVYALNKHSDLKKISAGVLLSGFIISTGIFIYYEIPSSAAYYIHKEEPSKIL